jgi:uncharacterized BrkB/YihY/UPF0761 family membrane protein
MTHQRSNEMNSINQEKAKGRTLSQHVQYFLLVTVLVLAFALICVLILYKGLKVPVDEVVSWYNYLTDHTIRTVAGIAAITSLVVLLSRAIFRSIVNHDVLVLLDFRKYNRVDVYFLINLILWPVVLIVALRYRLQ